MLLGSFSWLRECSVLYQANQLCSPWRRNVGFPLRVICMQNSGGQAPPGTIQVLARMVPAKVANWLQPASKCWFYPYKYLAVAVANIIWSIFRAPTAPLIPCSRSCLLVLPAPGIPPVQQSEITPAPLMTEIIQPSPEMSGLFATREQHFTLLGGCGVPWSLI